jgi:undecaprenyl-diphosphatase
MSGPPSLEAVGRLVLKLSHVFTLLLSLVFFFVDGKRKSVVTSVCFLFFATVFNTMLKHVFKVPLMPHLGPGYAFPSGHMHAVAVFWGSLMHDFDAVWFRVLAAAFILIEGAGLLICRFHHFRDVAGAAALAAIEVPLFHAIAQRVRIEFIAIGAIVACAAFTGVLHCTHRVETHVWIAFGGLTASLAAVACVGGFQTAQ